MRIALAKPWIEDEDRAAVLRALDSGVLVQGPEVEALEKEWAATCEAAHAVAVSSGTAALEVALRAHGIGPGDEVVTTPFTFIATVSSILHVGATPVFVDIEEESFGLDPARLEAALTARTKAIVPVHLFGQACDLHPIGEMARARGIAVIEDGAQAIGARYHGKAIGSFHTTTFSLYATKNVMSGEGGMITTGDAEIAERCRRLRSHGRLGKEEPTIAGFNFRMSEMHAALARVQLRRMPEATRRRSAHAERLAHRLEGLVGFPHVGPGRDHVWHQFTVRTPRRDSLAASLQRAGIGTGVFYRTPAHLHGFVRERMAGREQLNVAERVATEVLSLPVHPLLTDADLTEITGRVREFFDAAGAPPR